MFEFTRRSYNGAFAVALNVFWRDTHGVAEFFRQIYAQRVQRFHHRQYVCVIRTCIWIAQHSGNCTSHQWSVCGRTKLVVYVFHVSEYSMHIN